MRFALAVTLLAALAFAAPAGAAGTTFETPSGNIACAYFAKMVRCDVYSLPDTAFVVGQKGKGRRIDITDAVGSEDQDVLGYGKSRRMGPGFRCTSRRAGVTCRNTKTGHGFFVSRERQRVF